MNNIKIRRLNMDTSWELQWAGLKIVIDPWLIGSEVDYFSWFNEQWHSTDSEKINKIDKPDFILISQSYSDHCHEETLKYFDDEIPILASPKAYKRLLKSFSKNRLIPLPIFSKNGLFEIGNISIATLHPGRILDPVYYAHVICHQNTSIFYSSHGFELNPEQIAKLSEWNTELILTSFSEIELPSFLGGKVNPGMDNVTKLTSTLKPKYISDTHDEQKKHQGLVMKMAKTYYPNMDNLQIEGSEILRFTDYKFKELA